ncbi:thiamine pyrophosphate-binding protein [Rubellicoccus peritrichatus]|uniref:pyruvate decarboxylase n=1 Tax=Rubellicoccus peritrichatus TaxID=3080537 RepID=A0AAQ3QXG6_9BACT|nr:thiamine pyrophosphate-binding protein [Puniceicoccus sp. CR14]WOO43052.1 thiamine pyrophosphate-binding protein [Puniceicoccus sp. CR14]
MKPATTTLGSYLATRLEQIGIRHYFAVPGDYNLVLLDQLLENENLEFIGCCNELNLGYACDGYARANGVAAGFVTFSVGGLSAINAIAGAYAEDLPIIFVSGGPNTNAGPENRPLHHTLGEVRYRYQLEMFREVTAYAASIEHLEDAPEKIDRAIHVALRHRKPVYLEIACNLAGLDLPAAPNQQLAAPVPLDEAALDAAVENAAERLNNAVKPVLVAGVKLRPWDATKEFLELAEATGYAVAVMPNAKGLFPENHPQYIGTYWGPVSSPGCGEVVESADAYLFAGPTFTDYTTAGYTALINSNKLLEAGPERVKLPGQSYNNVPLPLFLGKLAGRMKKNDTSLTAFERFRPAPEQEEDIVADRPLLTRRVVKRVEKMLTPDMALIAETGDSWFNGIKTKLPEGTAFEIQMQYGSIGWSVGATLGYALAERGKRRVVSLIGDGSFQLTAQEVSTIIRYGLDPIIFLINNRGYTIEVEIHDGPYNLIKNWDYAGLIDVFNAEDGKGWGVRVSTEGELDAAIAKALAHTGGPSLIELTIDRDDCSKELLEWGSRVAAVNGAPPKLG